MRRLRAFRKPLVVTLIAAGCSSSDGGGQGRARDGAARPDGKGADARGADAARETTWTELRNGVCEVIPDCSPPAGTNINPCNPPPPRVYVDCPAELLPTQPPDTTVTRQDDGTCWVTCTDKTCDAPTPLRVACPADGAPPPTYAANVVIPAATTARYPAGEFRRNPDLTCDLVEPTRTITNAMCPPELIPTVAPGVVPVMNATGRGCFYGAMTVACPPRFHVWH